MKFQGSINVTIFFIRASRNPICYITCVVFLERERERKREYIDVAHGFNLYIAMASSILSNW